MAAETAADLSKAVCFQLRTLPEIVSAGLIAMYCAFDQEVNLNQLTAEFLEQGKQVLLPRFNHATGSYEMVEIGNIDRDTAIGYFGIREPRSELHPRSHESLSENANMAWLIPGVAFDIHGNRLGRGAGYYDRLLRGLPGQRIGVAYDWQVIYQLPTAEHDQRMNVIVTENRCSRLAYA